MLLTLGMPPFKGGNLLRNPPFQSLIGGFWWVFGVDSLFGVWWLLVGVWCFGRLLIRCFLFHLGGTFS